MLILETATHYLSYDPETGIFTRQHDYGSGGRFKAGTTAGTKGPAGYLYMNMRGKMVYLHRLAFLFMTGEMPPENLHIDHVDGNKENNRWDNLRLSTPSENHQNRWKANRAARRSSKYIGVYWSKAAKKWCAKIKVSGNPINLGCFDSEEDARDAYMAAKPKHHPFPFGGHYTPNDFITNTEEARK